MTQQDNLYVVAEDDAASGTLKIFGRGWAFSIHNLLQITYLSHLVYDFELRDGTGRPFPMWDLFWDQFGIINMSRGV